MANTTTRNPRPITEALTKLISITVIPRTPTMRGPIWFYAFSSFFASAMLFLIWSVLSSSGGMIPPYTQGWIYVTSSTCTSELHVPRAMIQQSKKSSVRILSGVHTRPAHISELLMVDGFTGWITFLFAARNPRYHDIKKIS
jgi:hypothetical protein